MAGDGVACSNQLIKFPLLLLSWCDIGGYTEVMKLFESKEGDVMAAPSFLLPWLIPGSRRHQGSALCYGDTDPGEEGDGWNPKSKSKQAVQLWQFPATSCVSSLPGKLGENKEGNNIHFSLSWKNLMPAQDQRAAGSRWRCSQWLFLDLLNTILQPTSLEDFWFLVTLSLCPTILHALLPPQRGHGFFLNHWLLLFSG